MNYTKILFKLEIEDMFGEEKTRDKKINIIERACLEAQLEALKGIVSASTDDFHKEKLGTYKMALIFHIDKAFWEIETKLKAMKP